MKKLVRRLFSYKIIRYCVGGGLAALLDLLLLYIFTDHFGLYYMRSAVLAFLFSLSFGYVFQKYITFQNYSRKHVVHGSLFVGFQLIGQGLYLGLLWLFVDVFGLYYLAAAIGVKIIVFLWNYFSNYFFNFKN